MRRLAQGHLDTQLGGAGDRPSSNHPVTSQPALPPELLSPHNEAGGSAVFIAFARKKHGGYATELTANMIEMYFAS